MTTTQRAPASCRSTKDAFHSHRAEAISTVISWLAMNFMEMPEVPMPMGTPFLFM